MVTNAVSPPASSSTIDPNPPPVMDFLIRKPQAFCYWFIPDQESQLNKTDTILGRSPLSSLGTSKANCNQDLSHGDLSHSNILVADESDIRLCDLSSFVQYVYPGRQMLSFLNNSSDTQLDTPQIFAAKESIVEDVRNLLIAFSYEPFDTQASYDLTIGFYELIVRKGKPVIRALAKLIREQQLSDNLICEALVSIGRLQDANTKSDRFELLANLLSHHVPIVREGATVGLSFMDDKKAIPYLRKAFTLETVRTLKGNIAIAIKDLETP